MLRRPPYPESLETRKEIEKHINELLDMDFIRNIGHNEIVDITTPVLITCHVGKSKLCEDFRALNNYTKADRYPITRIPSALDKLEKAKYITKMDCMKGFHQNGVKPNSMKSLRIICHMGIYKYTRMPFSIKNAPGHFQRIMDTIFQEEILEGWMELYIDEIIIYSETWEGHVQYIDRVLTPGHKVSVLSLAIDQNKVAAVLQKAVPRKIKEMQSFIGFASYYRNHIKGFAHMTSSLYKLCSKYVLFEATKERRYAYERIKYELTNAPVLILPYFELPFKLYIDSAFSQGLGAALHPRQIVGGQPREEVTCYISRQLKDSEARWALYNVKRNPAYDPEVAAKLPIHSIEINRKKNFRFSELAPESVTPHSGNTNTEGTETPILGIRSSELHTKFFNAVMKTYSKHKQCGILLQLLQQKYRSPELESQSEEPWLRDYKDTK
ncbi:hypothetical protein O181_068473 [Austropuccinia psidii MF-1]|uniref:Reverse transcriptase domain-containing protein n=1 Tax=Austropuccinia psidii MF-1 TaxID=1389203 RepID=A0A9Q3I5G5_9BASI|nr:hypothetical protein [Austropuccinia psidii MF-1]